MLGKGIVQALFRSIAPHLPLFLEKFSSAVFHLIRAKGGFSIKAGTFRSDRLLSNQAARRRRKVNH
jgi:hypothetical protein